MAAIDRLSKLPVKITDANDDPVPGAKVFFYTAGTTTPLNTYSDSARTIANTNPVIADSGGELDDVFMAAAQYKIVIKTAADVTLKTIDNVQGGFPTALAAALQSTSASNFRVNIGGTAHINAAVDYGLATAADDAARSTAFGLATLAGSTERRPVYIPTANVYTGANAWEFEGRVPLYSELKVYGDHFGTTLLDFNGTGGFYMPNADAGNPTSEVLLEGLHLRGTDHTGSTDNIGVEVRVARAFRMQNMLVERFTDNIVFDGAQFAGGQSGVTFVRLNEIRSNQNDAANISNNYPRYGIRFYSSTGSNQTQGVELNGVIAYSEITNGNGIKTITSGNTLTVGTSGGVRPLYRAAGVYVFREDAAGDTYTRLTHVASSPGTGEYTLANAADASNIVPGTTIRDTMANDIVSITVTTGDTATSGRNIRAVATDPKGLVGLSMTDVSGLNGSIDVGGFINNIEMDSPANSLLMRYSQITETSVKFGAGSRDSAVFLKEQSGSSILTKVDKTLAIKGRIQYLESARGFEKKAVTPTFSTASLTPSAITMTGALGYMSYLITEHPGPREVRAEMEVAVAGAAGSFGLFTLQVSYDGRDSWTTLSDTRVDVDFRGRIVLQAQDELMEDSNAQASGTGAATFHYRVLASSSSTSTTVYVFGEPPATTLTALESAGNAAMTVAEREHFFNGQSIRVMRDDGTEKFSYIATGGTAVSHPYTAVTGGGDLNMAEPLGSTAASGNAVTGMKVDSWLGVRDVNPF